MKSGEKTYVWQRSDWPHWRYDARRLTPLLAQAHQALGHLIGRLRDQGIGPQAEATLRALTEDVIKTSEIEGEHLNVESVPRSLENLASILVR